MFFKHTSIAFEHQSMRVLSVYDQSIHPCMILQLLVCYLILHRWSLCGQPQTNGWGRAAAENARARGSLE